MREDNFSIPNVNKASVGITAALYDRRALDCTSTLPLVNSLNHLAYLTTSSARIRDILTVDGGIERLVCILKEGRSPDMMSVWKWNLAFQCVVNIGVRGTELVRTRVVEADMVPVIATILENYAKVTEKCREKADEAKQKQALSRHDGRVSKSSSTSSSSSSSSSFTNRAGFRAEAEARTFRRHAPPPSIDVSASYAGPSTAGETQPMDLTSTTAQATRQHPLSTPPERSTFSASSAPSASSASRQLPPFRAIDGRLAVSPARAVAQPLPSAAAVLSIDQADGLARPNRDFDRLGALTPFSNHASVTSQPASPTTPLPPTSLRSPAVRPASILGSTTRPRRRPSIRHQSSTAEADDLNGDSMQSDESPDADIAEVAESAPVGIQDITMEESDSILADTSMDLETPTISETQDAGTFNITHRGPVDSSINTAAQPSVPAIALAPNRPAVVGTSPQPTLINSSVPRFLWDRNVSAGPELLAASPREGDVLMSLQLLAYVSKYCTLRSYFQNSHLVPRLKIGREFRLLDGDETVFDGIDPEKLREEYLLPDDYNIFPLVEKFTVRHHSPDMQYWAGVVMRNLCRKDETRGGIRQCAYYQCGKWEAYTRQFAKCRRCRRTKYCSKECQKSAWAFHRHWCVSASQ